MAKLIDDDGENRAVRGFLLVYGGSRGMTVDQMKKHMEWYGCPYWPDWVDRPEGRGEHLNKAAAQSWLRHLFALEPTTGEAP